MNESKPVPPPRHRGIYLLPNLFTTAAMFAGFYAIISAIGGHFIDAAIAVFLAAILDGMDGRVARMTGTQSEFGVQYDSLSDLVSFGLAPALVMYTWSLSALRDVGPLWGKLGWACAFIYAACAALRLARFNTQAGMADKRYFQGLASPAAAAVNMAFVWTMEKSGWTGSELGFVSAAIVIATGLLMVSRFRYFSFKSLPMGERGRVPFAWMVLVVLLLALLYLAPARVLLVGFSVYLLSGPIWTIWARLAHRRRGRRVAT
ncbi:MAG TPA: phosphatidylcholine/phosphatidylserine synthase [Rhodanobacter sp.]|nr:phosphatidylcholine/phosphatidylserine synthase [Rhodanobacter sp.]